MEKSTKLKIKRTLLMGMILSSLTGCGLKEKMDKGYADDRNEEDLHAVVNIGDNTIIFRSCDENYNIDVENNYRGGITYIEIYDEKGNKIDTIHTQNSSAYSGKNQGMLDIENKLIEDGAYLYQYKMDK